MTGRAATALAHLATPRLPDGRYLPRPGIFLVGAPRCGTSTLFRALRLNPQICAASPKETHFFVRPDLSQAAEDTAKYYAGRFFPHLADEHRVMLDGSVSYLYSADAVRWIDRLDPMSKFIVMVRNPVDLVHSYYHRLVYLLDEDAPSFADAWRLQADRVRGERLPRNCRDARFLRYGEIGRLGHYLEQMFELVGRSRCHVIVFDDLVSNADAVHMAVLDFIGIDRDERIRIKRKNGARIFLNTGLQRLYANPPKALLPLVEIEALRTAQWVKRLRKALKRRNTRRSSQPVLDPAMRPIVHAHFGEDIQRLSALLDRDLSHWR